MAGDVAVMLGSLGSKSDGLVALVWTSKGGAEFLMGYSHLACLLAIP
jgi:hypothetical protein